MSMIKCPECNNDVSSFAESCPRCGFPLAKARKVTIYLTYLCPTFPSDLQLKNIKIRKKGELYSNLWSGDSCGRVTLDIQIPTEVIIEYIYKSPNFDYDYSINGEAILNPLDLKEYKTWLETNWESHTNRISIY